MEKYGVLCAAANRLRSRELFEPSSSKGLCDFHCRSSFGRYHIKALCRPEYLLFCIRRAKTVALSPRRLSVIASLMRHFAVTRKICSSNAIRWVHGSEGESRIIKNKTTDASRFRSLV